VRIQIEWAEQLGTEHHYGEAVAALQPVLQLASVDASLAARASKDLIQNYLAWGDQARQQQAFRAALAHYQALGQAASCDVSCQNQVHAASAQALLGLAQQLAAGQQYDQAIATYQMLVAQYSDTPESQSAQAALTAPQPLVGRLIYHDMTPAANFLVLLASQWTFDSTAQVFKLAGQQYEARTNATGAFVLSSVAVGTIYMIAWVDANGNSGTCSTAGNQPLYTVRVQPLRATDAGAINIECA
jgi:tetratricopeptide (TPR) repeat protein